MTATRKIIPAAMLLATAGCVSGPGGSSNAANRAVTGIALGSLLGGVVGAATGTGVITGVAVGAVAGGAAGAAINTGGGPDTHGYCYAVDQQGSPIVVDMDAAACKAAGGSPAPNG